MSYKIYLRDKVTGFTRIYADSNWTSDEHVEFMFSDGNYSCDHNRILFITDHGKKGPDELKNNIDNEEIFNCVSNRIIVDKIENPFGKIIYEEK